MEQESLSEESIFGIARKIGCPDARDAYLAQVCGNDQALRERVTALLGAHDAAAGFLESHAPRLGATSDQPISEQPGTVIGSYKLLEQIGEGGMGVVYMADQQAPVRRRVALKIIKPGMDTRQVIARFEAERQALALMDHSNIARVLDVGATDSGRPYFVMELVRGVPITEYCDKNNLPVHERLELFMQVCQAVQHAHQKGIIHRDIKPSNVLVTMVEGRPVPKVIDFGVAKATNQQLTDKTLFTGFAQMIGTPLYMSPEQAEMTSLDVDTRSDIYSLGVLLYELLTGTTPFDQKRFREAALDEVRRIIREEDPPQPSTRISTLNEARTITAAQRKVDPNRLSQMLRGDLDWIVMKSIEKDRTQRYETANALVRDVQRYLANEPVEACPHSATYRFRKFARRNRAAFATAALVVGALVLGTVVSAWQAVRATHAERVAEVARNEETQQRKIAEAERTAAEASFQKARAAVDKYFTLVSESTLLDVPGLQPLRMKLLEAAVEFYQGIANERTNDPAVLADLAATYLRFAIINHVLDRNDNAVAAIDQALKVIDRLRREYPAEHEQHRKMAGYWKGYRPMQVSTAMPNNPLAVLQPITRLAATWQALSEENPEEPAFRSDLAALYLLIGELLTSGNRIGEGMNYFEKAKAILEKLTHDQPKTPEYRANLAGSYEFLARNLPLVGRKQEAEANWSQALAIREQLVVELPQVSQYQTELAFNLVQVASGVADRDPEEAEKLYRRAVEVTEQLIAASPSVPLYIKRWSDAQYGLVDLLVKSGHETQANEQRLHGAQFMRQLESKSPSESLERAIAVSYGDRGDALARGGRREESLAMFREAIPRYEKLAANPDCAARVRSNLGYCYGWVGGLENNRKAAAIFARLMAEVPSYKAYQEALANSLLSIGEHLTAERDFTEAETSLQRAIELNARLTADAPRNLVYRGNLAQDHRSRGDMLAAAGRADDALAAHRTAVEMFARMAHDEPKKLFWRQELAYCHMRLGQLHQAAGRLEEAKSEYLQALPVHERLVGDSGNQPIFDERLYQNRGFLIDLALLEGNFTEAERLYRQAIVDYELLAAKLPKTVVDQWLANFFSGLAKVLIETDQVDEAVEVFRKSIDHTPQGAQLLVAALNEKAWALATSATPELRNPARAVKLATQAADLNPLAPEILNTLGVAHYRLGNWQDAIAWLDKSVKARDGGDSFDWFFLAMAHQRLGHSDEARKRFDQAVEWTEKNKPTDEELLRFRTEAKGLVVDKSAVDAKSENRD